MKHPVTRRTLFLSLMVLAAPAAAEDITAVPLPVPSGQPVYWQETIHGTPGTRGLTYRFRFVAPDLADLVPWADAAPMDELTEEDLAALENLADSEGDPAASILSTAVDDGLISQHELTLAPAMSVPDAEEVADAVIASELDGEVLPPAPAFMVQDPMHDDIVWLCENFVLPRIASPAPRPTEIVISLSDRPTAAGDLATGAVQLFEAFSLPPDRDICVWEPF
ncbi:DUF6497 family protein [Paracoccus sp. S1E-3]|uniref:DUF6497 family protein n=1 Tax=Paracoccus sp. S1E-3 TaxID=2756130 RepID=UPI0015EF411D|nr:DUF6497 family protein [Paracoccus sp. S1E-3]MBA4489526.1 hypothetical protein [Paracoccus sp. S1E-3]